MRKHLAALGLAVAVAAACEPNRNITDPDASLLARAERDDDDRGPRAVYTITNQVSGNAVAVFARAADGTLTPAGTFATGGTGTGAGLGSQGAVTVSNDGRLVFAVNAGSNDVSVLRVGSTGLSLLSRTPSGGTLPTSITVYQNVVYVLNAGGAGNITGFTLRNDGGLTPIAGSTKSLSGSATDPAQVSFSPDGRQLAVTEKATNLIDVYPVAQDGVAGERESFPSAGGTPFGFAFGPRKLLFVSEAAAPGSASSYVLNRSGNLRLVSGVVATHQGAPCWAVVTADGRFGYTGNGAGSVSGFNIRPNGEVRLFADNGATAVIAGGVNDIALSANSRFLYALKTGGAQEIHAFRIQNDGSLTALGPVGGLPAGTRGLAAF
ncbi:MAG TPA: beta-propeller fold lactonase family protein [Gemmatimonadales bacterium]|nr:beta-propeller fold lactonase family protein [Gemmatimonadales bacterium]